jgi:hypothetical protein
VTSPELTRTMVLTVPKDGDRCSGCGMQIAGGLEAVYRLDGSLFCTDRCAAIHSGIPLDNSAIFTAPTEPLT